MTERSGFYDAVGRWWPFASLSMSDLDTELRAKKLQPEADRPAGENDRDFAMRRLVEWAVSSTMIERGISSRQLRAAMPRSILLIASELLVQASVVEAVEV